MFCSIYGHCFYIRNRSVQTIQSLYSNFFISGHYLYLEGSTPRKEGDRARLISTKTVKSEHKCLKFFYFMYGSEIGELNVYLKYGVSGKDILIWSLQEEQGKEWKRAMVPLPSWHSSFKVSGLNFV